MKPYRVLICGGRKYKDYAKLKSFLDEVFLKAIPNVIVIHGGAQGADSLADRWAKEHNLPVIAEPADWATHGKAAGPIRNQKMLDVHKPDMVIAFPGGRGTRDMKERARRAKVPVVTVRMYPI